MFPPISDSYFLYGQGGSEGKSDEGFHNKTNIETHCNIVNLRGCDPGPAGQFSVEVKRVITLGGGGGETFVATIQRVQ